MIPIEVLSPPFPAVRVYLTREEAHHMAVVLARYPYAVRTNEVKFNDLSNRLEKVYRG